MKKLLALVLFSLVACTPATQQPADLVVPAEAGRFAKITFQASADPAFNALRKVLDSGSGDFLLLGGLKEKSGFVAFWQKVAGQGARVYFKFEPSSDGANTLIRVLTVPAVAPEPQKLAQSLDVVADRVKDALGLRVYTLEPDR